MGSKSLKIAFITMLFPIIGMAQGVAFRKADTALVTNDAGALRVFKSKPYYSSLLALKVKYTDTLTKIATKANLLPYALISNSVLLTGNQTVGGIKTFSSSLVLNGLTSSAAVGIGITPSMPLHVKGQFRVERISAVQYTQIDHEAGATTILSKNTVSSIYSSINISQGNNTTDRNVINIDGNGKVAMAFAASVATAPSASTDVVRKTDLDAGLALKVNVTSILTATATLDFPSVAAFQNSILTISVTGAAIGDVVSIGLPNSILTGLSWNASFIAWVSSTNTVTVMFQNNDPINPHDLASASFTVKVLK